MTQRSDLENDLVEAILSEPLTGGPSDAEWIARVLDAVMAVIEPRTFGNFASMEHAVFTGQLAMSLHLVRDRLGPDVAVEPVRDVAGSYTPDVRVETPYGAWLVRARPA